MTEPYYVPIGEHRTEIEIQKSRFITTIRPTPTVADAKACLASIRAEMPDASHHVYAYRVGFGNSTIEGMSDDGEPSGTAGPPVLAVLRGTDIGDITIVVTRYFGGIKLGTGGLVRAYTESAQTALKSLPTELKIAKSLVGVEMAYPHYTPIKRLLPEFDAVIQSEEFTGDVMLVLQMPTSVVDAFTSAVIELTAGSVTPLVFEA